MIISVVKGWKEFQTLQGPREGAEGGSDISLLELTNQIDTDQRGRQEEDRSPKVGNGAVQTRKTGPPIDQKNRTTNRLSRSFCIVRGFLRCAEKQKYFVHLKSKQTPSTQENSPGRIEAACRPQNVDSH